jgi:hypothetical protein
MSHTGRAKKPEGKMSPQLDSRSSMTGNAWDNTPSPAAGSLRGPPYAIPAWEGARGLVNPRRDISQGQRERLAPSGRRPDIWISHLVRVKREPIRKWDTS